MARLLTDKLKPLVGKTQSFIKDSSHFVHTIRSTKIKESDFLVNFDIVSLYNKVLVKEAIAMIRGLTNNKSVNLVEVCLRSTYFSYRMGIYE